MSFVLWLIVVLLVLILVLLILLLVKVPAFKKEAKEFYIAMKEGLSDRKLTEEEKVQIRKEWADIDWKAAITELIASLKSKK